MIVTLGMAITLICQSDTHAFYKCRPEGTVRSVTEGFVTVYEVDFLQCELTKRAVTLRLPKSCFKGFEEEDTSK